MLGMLFGVWNRVQAWLRIPSGAEELMFIIPNHQNRAVQIELQSICKVSLASPTLHYHNLLVGGIPAPLKNMSSSVGMMTFPTEWKVIKFTSSKPPISIYIYTIYH